MAKATKCPKCGGEGCIWGYELSVPPSGNYQDINDDVYTCDVCKGKGFIIQRKEQENG